MQSPLPADRIWFAVVQSVGIERCKRGLVWLCGIGFALFVVGLTLLAIAMPEYPFDLVAYIKSALIQSGIDVDTAHQQAWESVKSTVSAAEFETLSQGDAYRMKQSSDPSAFATILPLYQVKIGYIALLNLAQSALPMVKLAFLANYVAGLAIGILTLIWMMRGKTLMVAPAIAALLLLTQYFEQIRSPSPDILASALILGGIMLWMVKRDWAANTLWLAAFLFRPDTLLLLFAVVIANVLFRQRRIPALLAFATAIGLSIVIQSTMDHPGWWVHYWFSTVSLLPTLEGFDPGFSLFAWAKGQARGVYMALFEFNWIAVFALLASFTAWLSYQGNKFSPRQQAALAVFAMTISGKFILFPLPDDRLYSIFLLAAALVLSDVCLKQKMYSENKLNPV